MKVVYVINPDSTMKGNGCSPKDDNRYHPENKKLEIVNQYTQESLQYQGSNKKGNFLNMNYDAHTPQQ